MSKSGFFWNDRESRFSLIVKQGFKNNNSRHYDRRSVQKLSKLSSPRKEKIIVLTKETNNIDEINNFFMNNYWNKIGIFVKQESKRFQGSTFDTSSRRKLIKDRDTILDLTSKNDSVECYADLFTIALQNDDKQEFDSK